MKVLTEKDVQLSKKEIQAKYGFKNYRPSKNSKPVYYEGKMYLSKVQCRMLNGLTVKELDEYIENNPTESVVVFKAHKDLGVVEFEADFDSVDDEEIVEETAEETAE